MEGRAHGLNALARVRGINGIMRGAIDCCYLLEEPIVEFHELGEADAVVMVRVETRKAFLDL